VPSSAALADGVRRRGAQPRYVVSGATCWCRAGPPPSSPAAAGAADPGLTTSSPTRRAPRPIRRIPSPPRAVATAARRAQPGRVREVAGLRPAAGPRRGRGGPPGPGPAPNGGRRVQADKDAQEKLGKGDPGARMSGAENARLLLPDQRRRSSGGGLPELLTTPLKAR